MRVILAHADDSTNSLAKQVFQALLPIWAEKDAAVLERSYSSGKLVAVKSALHLPDVVISTSPSAAAQLGTTLAVPHICYLTTDDRITRLSTVTHFVTVRPSSHPQCNGRETDHVLPPVDTRFYSPGRVRREPYYVMVCRDGWGEEHQAAVDACQLGDRRLIVVSDESCGSLSAERLRDHYRHCRAVLLPTPVEFDSSAVEAQACGAPVIAFAESGIAETLIDAEETGNGTGLLFDEPTPQSIWSAMQELERRPQRCSATLAWAQAARFSVARFQHEFRRLVEQIVADTQTLPAFTRWAA